MKLPGVQSLPVPSPTRRKVQVPDDPVGAALSGISQQLGQTSDVLMREFEKEKKRIDRYRVEEAFTELKNHQIDISLGENGYTKVKGGDAIKRPLLKEYSDLFQKKVDEISKGLTESQAKEFSLRAGVASSQLMQGVLSHTAGEQKAHQEQVLSSTIEVEKSSAALHWHSPSDAMASIERVKASVNDYAEANGFDDKMTKAAQLKALSGVHRAIISRAVDAGNPDYAALWIKTHKAEIDGATMIEAEKSIKMGRQVRLSQQVADKLMTSNMDETEMLAEVRKNYSGEDRKAIEVEIRSRNAELRRTQREAAEDSANQAWRMKAEGKSFNAIPTSVKSSMSGKALEILRSSYEREANGDTGRTPGQESNYYELMNMAGGEDTRSKFMQQDLRTYDLHKSDFDRLTKLRLDINVGGFKTIEFNRALNQAMRISEPYLIAGKLSLKPKEGSKAAERIKLYKGMVSDWIINFQKENKRSPSAEETTKQVRLLLMEGYEDVWGRDPSKYLFEIPPGQRLSSGKWYLKTSGDIPKEDLMKITSYWRKNNPGKGEPSESTIRALYIQFVIAGEIKHVP